MASTNMKAVVTLTADASGIQAGVTQAMRHLNKMQEAVSSIRGLAVAQIAMDLGRNIFGGIGAEFQRIQDAAHQFSPDAMSGANSLTMAEQSTSMQLADAFGPIVGLIDELKAQALKDVTQYLVDNKEAIGQAMLHIAEFGVAIGELTAGALVKFTEALNYVFDLIENPTQVLADTTVGLTAEIFGQDAGRWLEGIYNRLGGD